MQMSPYCLQKVRIVFVIMLGCILALISCENNTKHSSLDIALELAGDNRIELEKVLHHYQQDSLKLKAAIFLIENMPYYYSYVGDPLDSLFIYYKDLSENHHKTPSDILDSFTAKYGTIHPTQLSVKYDIQEVDSAYLCNNIDWSFKVWEEQPWGKNVSFEDFCEYILPYRVGNEKLVYWKEAFYNKYKGLLEEIEKQENPEDPVTAAKLLINRLDRSKTRFSTVAPQGGINFGPFASEYLTGTCEDLSHFVAYICRSLGIPCHIEFVPATGVGETGSFHYWTSFHNNKKELYVQEFMAEVNFLRYDRMRTTNKSKVYRKTFSINHQETNKIADVESSIYPFFKYPNFFDVTVFYSDCYAQELEIPISNTV